MFLYIIYYNMLTKDKREYTHALILVYYYIRLYLVLRQRTQLLYIVYIYIFSSLETLDQGSRGLLRFSSDTNITR